MWFADILFNSEFDLKIMRESIIMMTKMAIKPLSMLSDQSLLVNLKWISEHKDILSNVKINIISQINRIWGHPPTCPRLRTRVKTKVKTDWISETHVPKIRKNQKCPHADRDNWSWWNRTVLSLRTNGHNSRFRAESCPNFVSEMACWCRHQKINQSSSVGLHIVTQSDLVLTDTNPGYRNGTLKTIL